MLPDCNCKGWNWNADLINWFIDDNHEVASKMFNTPLFTDVVAKKYVWKVENDGMYSVRSVCRMCQWFNWYKWILCSKKMEASSSLQNQESNVEKLS
jgi:hypothetical protein